MTSLLKDFIARPALEKIDNLVKYQILAVAELNDINLKQNENIMELKRQLTEEL